MYSLLRGKDLETAIVSPERREQQFEVLREAQEHVLDTLKWQEFLKCPWRAGFRGSRMISSENALLYTYALWLVGRRDYDVGHGRLREVIARWFFMAQTTGRYTSAPESTTEGDFARLRHLAPGDADGFCAVLDKLVADTFTDDYWAITLPNEMDSSASKSPALLAYLAALNVLDAEVLFSGMKVRELLDPSVNAGKGLDRHHLFPKAYLKSIGITGTRQVNQIANMALLEWWENIGVSDDAPSVYWPKYEAAMASERVALHRHWHALPEDWHLLSYAEFLERRRRRMGEVVREGYQLLAASRASG